MNALEFQTSPKFTAGGLEVYITEDDSQDWGLTAKFPETC